MSTGIVVGIILGIMVLLVVATIVTSVRRRNMARQMLAADPYLPLVFTSLGQNLQTVVQQSVGVGAQVQISSVDGKAAPTMLTPDGQFTPVTPGPHQLKLVAFQKLLGRTRTFSGEIGINLARGQRIFVEVDTQTGQWLIRPL